MNLSDYITAFDKLSRSVAKYDEKKLFVDEAKQTVATSKVNKMNRAIQDLCNQSLRSLELSPASRLKLRELLSKIQRLANDLNSRAQHTESFKVFKTLVLDVAAELKKNREEILSYKTIIRDFRTDPAIDKYAKLTALGNTLVSLTPEETLHADAMLACLEFGAPGLLSS